MIFIQHKYNCSLKTIVSMMQSHRARNRTQTKNLERNYTCNFFSKSIYSNFFNSLLKNTKSKVMWHSTEYEHVLFPFPSS